MDIKSVLFHKHGVFYLPYFTMGTLPPLKLWIILVIHKINLELQFLEHAPNHICGAESEDCSQCV